MIVPGVPSRGPDGRFSGIPRRFNPTPDRLRKIPDRLDRTTDRLIKTKGKSDDIFLTSDGVPPAINGRMPRAYYATFTMKIPKRLIAIYERAYIDVFTLKSVKREI
jgi:hypothetical protein